MKEWISGRNPVYEVLQARRRHFFELKVAQGADIKGRLQQIIAAASGMRLPIRQVPRQQLDSISENHQGVALLASGYPYSDLQTVLALSSKRGEAGFFLVLDSLQDPQNLGTLLRTAESTAVHGVFIPSHRAAGVTPAVEHASSGASEHLQIAAGNLVQVIEALKDAGAWVIGLEGSPQAQPIESANLSGPLALVVGSEGAGLRSLVSKSCDLLVRLPMRGRVESLNAAVAGSIALYLAYQARLPEHPHANGHRTPAPGS